MHLGGGVVECRYLGSRTGEAAFDTADNRLRLDSPSAFCPDSRQTLAFSAWQVVAEVRHAFLHQLRAAR